MGRALLRSGTTDSAREGLGEAPVWRQFVGGAEIIER